MLLIGEGEEIETSLDEGSNGSGFGCLTEVRRRLFRSEGSSLVGLIANLLALFSLLFEEGFFLAGEGLLIGVLLNLVVIGLGRPHPLRKRSLSLLLCFLD